MDTRVHTPHNQVTGVLREPSRLATVLEAVQAAGFVPEAVTVGRGEEGLTQVDPDGSQHGLRGRITRALELYGQEGEEHREAVNALQAGHLLLVVTLSGPDDKERAAAVLRSQGVVRLRYWGPWEVEELLA